MRKFALCALAAVLLSLPILGTGCTKLQARDHLNKGVNAFKNAQYPEAVEHFKQAVELDPNYPIARLYLATAYMQQYIPGSDSPENLQMANAAETAFKDVLKDDPKNTTAIAYLASLYLNEKRWDDSRAWYDKLTQVDPKSAVGYYSKGFIAWSQWYPADGTARASLGMKLDDPGPIKDKKVREELKEKYGSVIQEGLDSLDKALQVDPKYDDAMAYENLLIRERADLADNKEEYEQQIKIANDWVDKAMAVKKEKMEAKQKTSGGIVTDAK
ncbi:MAG TPA: tetratricopeptide repeat protein [Bryobacteraceae bacterium]|jgi:Tfp pilus assembly protein PilF|nr:tetratricopeptide repeat protein [Bryobacteraceae bacterium]